MFRFTLLAILFSGAICSCIAQQPIYTVNNSVLVYNPAFAGSMRCPRIQNGNTFIPGMNYYSGYIYADATLISNHAAGIFVEQQFSEKNAFKKTELKLNYSFHKNITRNFSVKAGISGSYNFHSYSDSILFVPFNLISPSSSINFPAKKNYFDLGAGILGFSKNYYFGVSWNHIAKPVYRFGERNLRLVQQFNFHGYYQYGKNRSNHLSAIYMFQSGSMNKEAAPLKLFLITYEKYFKEVFSVGFGWTHFDDINLMHAKGGLKFLDQWSLYYQYNYPLKPSSDNESQNYSSIHETGVNFQFYCRPKKKSFRTISCPSFGGGYGLFSGGGGKYRTSTSTLSLVEKNTDGEIDTAVNKEEYAKLTDNPFKSPYEEPLSTFSVDVDRASYSNVKRMVESGLKPDPDAVRIEEFLNYFNYDYPEPKDEHPFSVTTEFSDCPWNKKHKLLLIGIKGKNIPLQNIPASHLVFLIDVSGSMGSPDKLPLVKESLKLLMRQLRQEDKISIVTYSEKINKVLSGVTGNDTMTIVAAIDSLYTSGGTNGGEGLQTAYEVAEKYFIQGGNNRIILATDGDFNIGISSDKQLESFIEKKRNSGIYMSALGFGYGNYKDSKLEIISDKGNGNYAYINEISEARKTMVNEFGGTLFTIANDVKLQTEINPLEVNQYRLIGYENRLLNKEDFNNDTIDAGDIGINHSVTALYEIIPINENSETETDTMYKTIAMPHPEMVVNRYARTNNELMVIKLRYKIPGDTVSRFISTTIYNEAIPNEKVSENFQLASSLAAFGMTLRNSPYKGTSDFQLAEKLALMSLKSDKEGWRKEYILLLDKARNLK